VKEYLKNLLSPADDGRAFTDAVLLKASGALFRRRAAAQAALAQRPAWEWLAQWARPWVVAALAALAVVAIYPSRPWASAPASFAVAPADSDVMNAALLPADMAVATAPEVYPER
jgi:hypothetical protein